MTITDMLGTPVTDPADPLPATPDRCRASALAHPAEATEPGRRNPVWSVLTAAMALCVGVAVGAYWAPGKEIPTSPPARRAAAADIPSSVAGLAELFVATQLSGVATEQDLATLHPADTPMDGGSGLWVNRAVSVDGTAIGDDVWRMTVAADVLEMIEGAYQPAGIQYYTVTVAETDAQPVAVTAPSRIPPPHHMPQPVTAARFAGAVPPDQGRAVEEFLNAYLTGHGEVARYVAATARIAVFPTPPYESITIESLASDSLGRVRARLTATTTNEATQTLEYTLEMAYAGGVWEVLTLASVAPQG